MVARLLSVTPLLVYEIICLFGLVQFRLWSQVNVFWSGNDPWAEIIFHYHGIRYMLVYPLFKLSEWTGLSPDYLFTITAPLLILLVAWFATRSVQTLGGNLSPTKRVVVFAGISTFFILLSLFMNGRLLFAMAGMSILLWTLLDWNFNRDLISLCSILAAFLLCSVSTGTFLVAITAFYTFIGVNLVLRNPAVRRRRILLYYAVLLVLLTPHVSALVFKVFDYFGGGIDAMLKMLGHGYGLLLIHGNLAIPLAGCLVLAGLFFVSRKLLARYWILSGLIIFCLAGGMFGISTAMIVLPLLMVVFSLIALELVERLRIKGQER